MQLPQTFIEKYQEILGDEAEAFFASFDEKPISGFRVNPLKEHQISFSSAIPGTPWGYYGKISGKSIEHVTGLVYSQEPAAQMVGEVAKPKQGLKVLDLAAAPGGKTTHLLSYLGNTGVLVSNEINSKRSKILSENVERFGARNVIVTNESAANLAKVFKQYFDVIVFDGPCSGEGMFRKDPDAIQYWHKEYPNELSELQKSILSEALSMLAPGGELIYSTCTWSPEENEGVVSWLLDTYPDLELVTIPAVNGMMASPLLTETVRLYPHRFQGEGQFIAKFKDKSETLVFNPSNTKKKKKKKPRSLSKEQLDLWTDFSTNHLTITLDGEFQLFGDNLYCLPKDLPDLSSLKITRNGLHLGTFKKKRFEPSFALGMALRPSEVVQKIEIDIEQFELYVAGQEINLSESYPSGWYQVLVNGNGLGFAKVVGKRLKNHYPKGLRFQT
ncbi:RsmF rRNA methyltransferase first C-terminal domain-containing protein [Streptococcus suis]|nr:RsmF rRNA methyltransferase first C-terminal domain-containing protein [Streptococcus suis]